MKTKHDFSTQPSPKSYALLALVALAVSGLLVSTTVYAGKTGKMSTPSLSCGTSTGSSIEIQVTAGETGAPAGFSVQWMTKEEFDLYGWSDNPAPATSFCKAGFSGVPGASQYNLAVGASVAVQIGDNLFDTLGASSTCPATPLNCGTDYVFRAFAHATNTLFRSDFTPTLVCRTQECSDPGCTFTQGYWKTHGPSPTGNNVNVWPVASLTLGTVTYSDTQLQQIFDTPAKGNGLISVAHQLIAAKLNIANGASGSSIASTIAAADALIGGLVVPPIETGFLPSSATTSLTTTLDSYNSGLTGPGHCQ